MTRLVAIVVVAAAAAAACADAGDGASDPESLAQAPLLGVDGSTDAADRSCHVVLRDLARNRTGNTWESVVTPGGSTSWIWQGSIEISEAATAEGLVPHALYRLGTAATWTAAVATPTGTAATPGFVGYTIRLAEGLPGPGWSGTALASARIQVAPFLALAQGGRLFDHNRHPGDFDNFVVATPDYAVPTDPNVCAPATLAQRAKLVFDRDHHEHREGVLVPGGALTIAYDTNRLTTCRHARNGNALWEMTAHVQFETGAAPIRRTVSVRDAAATLSVPRTATGVTLWFENTSASGCQAWDSNLGANYFFEAARAPQWIGEARNLITRGASDPCDGGAPAQQGYQFDTWARQRAAITSLCFQVYQPGVTDRDDADLWQKLDVAMKWRYVGESTWRMRSVAFDRRVGNNARYLLTWRDHDAFRSYTCPPVTPRRTADGQYVTLDVEYVLVVNGGELRPQPGAAFVGTFMDDANDVWRDANCQ